MEDVDSIAVIIAAAGLLVTAVSAFLAYLTFRAQHKWSRRKAAQEATLLFNQRVKGRDLLKEHLDYVSSFDPIPLAQLDEKFGEEPELKPAVHSLLNYFEMLARGINQHIYDEEIVRTAWKGAMIRAIDRFRPYIKRRRKQSSKNAWRELEGIVDEWRHRDTKVSRRAATG